MLLFSHRPSISELTWAALQKLHYKKGRWMSHAFIIKYYDLLITLSALQYQALHNKGSVCLLFSVQWQFCPLKYTHLWNPVLEAGFAYLVVNISFRCSFPHSIFLPNSHITPSDTNGTQNTCNTERGKRTPAVLQ